MNKFIFCIVFFSSLNAYEQGYIDMHGKNEKKLLDNKIDFTIKSIDFLLHDNKSKKKDDNSSKIKYLEIDDIEKIEKI